MVGSLRLDPPLGLRERLIGDSGPSGDLPSSGGWPFRDSAGSLGAAWESPGSVGSVCKLKFLFTPLVCGEPLWPVSILVHCSLPGNFEIAENVFSFYFGVNEIYDCNVAIVCCAGFAGSLLCYYNFDDLLFSFLLSE